MDFGSIGQRRLLLGTASDRNSPQLSFSIGSAVERTRPTTADDLVKLAEDYSPPSQRSGRYLQLSQAKAAVDLVEDGVNRIYEIRNRQLAIVKEAKDLPQGAKTEAIADEYNSLDSEIQRIISSATVAGTSVLTTNPSYSLNEPNNNLNNLVFLPNVSQSLQLEPTVIVTIPTVMNIQSDFSRYYELLNDNVNVLSGVKADVSSAAKKVTDIVEKTLVPEFRAPGAPNKYDEAAILARDIARDLGSQFSDEESAANIIEASIGKLKPDRAKDLLSNEP